MICNDEITFMVMENYKPTSSRKEYIKNQLQEDIAYDQISLQEYIDLFTE